MSVYPAPLLFVALLCSQALAERDGAIEIQSTHMTRQSILSKDPEVPPVNPYDKDVDPTMAGLDVVKAAQEALVASGTGLFATSSVFDKHLSDYGASLKTATDKLKGLMGKMVTTVQTEREALLAKEQLRLAGIADVTNSLYTRAVDYKLEPRDEQVPPTLHQDAHLSNWLENDRIDMTREKAAAAAAASDVTHVFNQDIAPGTVVPSQPKPPASSTVSSNSVDPPMDTTDDDQQQASVLGQCEGDGTENAETGKCTGCMYEKDGKRTCRNGLDSSEDKCQGLPKPGIWCEASECKVPPLPEGGTWTNPACNSGVVPLGQTCDLTAVASTHESCKGAGRCKDTGKFVNPTPSCTANAQAAYVPPHARCYWEGDETMGPWIEKAGCGNIAEGKNKEFCEICFKGGALDHKQEGHCIDTTAVEQDKCGGPRYNNDGNKDPPNGENGFPVVTFQP